MAKGARNLLSIRNIGTFVLQQSTRFEYYTTLPLGRDCLAPRPRNVGARLCLIGTWICAMANQAREDVQDRAARLSPRAPNWSEACQASARVPMGNDLDTGLWSVVIECVHSIRYRLRSDNRAHLCQKLFSGLSAWR